MRMTVTCALVAAVWGLGAAIQPLHAQGLLWNLPPEGTWVRYEGTYREVELRPDNPEGDLTIEWIRHLTIKSLGSETAEYEGAQVPCRWIEIESITGISSELGIDPGPAGPRVIKVLVPESRIIGDEHDAEQIPVAFVPVIKGFRQFGDGEVEPIETGVLRVYPLLTLLAYYQDMQAVSETDEPLTVPLGTFNTRRYSGTLSMESAESRSVNRAEIWRSPDVPFGLAQWNVKLTREHKLSYEPRSAFQSSGEVNVEMSAHESGTDAESTLNVP